MIVYKYTNKVNGKQYIGQTIRGFRERHKQHLRDNTTYFDRALSKYGEDSFEWEILYEASNSDDLNEKEIELIQKYNTIKPNGYNITLGENSFSGYSHTDKTRRKISESLKSFYKENPYIFAGENNPCYGVRWSDERKNEMSKIKQSFWKDNDKARKEMSEIKKRHYRDNPELRELKSRQTKEWIANNGHHFKGKKHTEESKMKMSKALKGRKMSEEAKVKMRKNNGRKRKVVNVDTGEVFDSLREAAESVDRNKSGISNACRREKGDRCGGYRWSYLDGYQAASSIMELEMKAASKDKEDEKGK